MSSKIFVGRIKLSVLLTVVTAKQIVKEAEWNAVTDRIYMAGAAEHLSIRSRRGCWSMGNAAAPAGAAGPSTGSASRLEQSTLPRSRLLSRTFQGLRAGPA